MDTGDSEHDPDEAEEPAAESVIGGSTPPVVKPYGAAPYVGGNQPAPSGSLGATLQPAIVGNQPAPSGSIEATLQPPVASSRGVIRGASDDDRGIDLEPVPVSLNVPSVSFSTSRPVVVPLQIPEQLAEPTRRAAVLKKLTDVRADLVAMEQANPVETALIDVLAVTGIDLATTALELLDSGLEVWEAARDRLSRGVERIRAGIEAFEHSAVGVVIAGAAVIVGLLTDALQLFDFMHGLF